MSFFKNTKVLSFWFTTERFFINQSAELNHDFDACKALAKQRTSPNLHVDVSKFTLPVNPFTFWNKVFNQNFAQFLIVNFSFDKTHWWASKYTNAILKIAENYSDYQTHNLIVSNQVKYTMGLEDKKERCFLYCNVTIIPLIDLKCKIYHFKNKNTIEQKWNDQYIRTRISKSWENLSETFQLWRFQKLLFLF